MRPVKRRPRSSPSRRQKTRLWLRRSLIGIIVLTVVGACGFGIAVAYAWRTVELPPEKPLAQSTTLTDVKGGRLATFSSQEDRSVVKLNDVSPILPRAVLATEDKDFYSHNGVNFWGIGRAVLVNVRSGGVVQGGSTITQQYVKTVYVGSERTLGRKFKEAVLSMKLESQLTKDEILERYLNAIYFGRGAYGVETAARHYYGKSANNLDLAEASYLAGLIRGPELADVTTHPQVAEGRRAVVLDRMVRNGLISQADADAVNARPIASYTVARTAQEPNVVGADKGTEYFVSYVHRLLVLKYGEEKVSGGGLRVKTTLDMDLQTKAYDATYGLLKPEEPSASLVSIDGNGEIKAMVGGRDWAKSKVNLALGRDGGGSGRQAGSTFKPFALAAALEEGVCYKETYPAPSRLVFPKADNGKDWPVSNYGGERFPDITLEEATAHSVNTVYARLALDTGPAKIVSAAKEAGITSPLNPNPSLVLGTDTVSTLEMAGAYLTFAKSGVHVTPTPILEVRDSTGAVLERARVDRKRVMSADVADTVNQLLQQVVLRGTGKAAQIGRPVAGKTGTTEDYGDAWFVGYTPNLSTAVWMGYPESSARKMTSVRGGPVTGGGLPSRIFSTYMKAATANTEKADFPAAPNCSPKKSSEPPPPTTAPGLVTVPEQTTTTEPRTTTTKGRGPTTTERSNRTTTTVKDEEAAGPGVTALAGLLPG